MKTDRFTDIIRRKLESIRPEFTENDWTKMQASLQQVAPPSTIVQHPASRAWFARPWVPLTAAASVAALVAVAAWQRSEIATLRQTVQALNTTKPAITQSHSTDLDEQTTTPTIVHQTDTVYITRYVPAPAKSSPGVDQPEERGQWVDASAPNEASHQGNSVASAPDSRSQRRSMAGSVPGTAGTTPSSEAAGTIAGQFAVNRPIRTLNERTTDQPTHAATGVTDRNQPGLEPSGTNVTTTDESTVARSRTKTPREQLRSSTSQRGQTSTTGAYADPESTDLPGQPGSTSGEAAGRDESALAGNFDQLANQPLQLTDTDWNTLMLRKATRRMRPVRTITVGGTQAQTPASQSVANVTPRFRLGIGGDITTRSRSTAITGELILGKHWTLGVGYGQSVCSDGNFLSEKEFNMKNQQPFRKEFDKELDPKADPSQFIANISLKREQTQVPLQLGYRIPLTQSFTILPTVGTTLTLSNTERLTFDRIAKVFGGYSDIIKVESSRDRPYDVFNNLAFGTAVEWQKKHWVAQAGPLATAQLAQISNPSTFSTFTVGARVRLLYQF